MLERKEWPGTQLLEYKGTLPPAQGGAVNAVFLIHPLGLEDLGLFTPDPKVAQKMIERQSQEELLRDFGKIRRMFAHKCFGYAEVHSGDRKSHVLFMLIPFLPKEYLDRSKQEEIIDCQLRALEKAKLMNAGIAGLGAHNSIVSMNGLLLIKSKCALPITSGNALTAFAASQGLLKACQEFGLELGQSTITIVGATGNIGEYLSKSLIPHFSKGYLVARTIENLKNLAQKIPKSEFLPATNINQALSQSRVVILATNASSSEALGIDPQSLLPGTIICDVGLPHNLSPALVESRADVFCFDGGIYQFPGSTFDCAHVLRMGGEHSAFACLTEMMARALKGQNASGGVGQLKVREVEEMARLVKEYGFELDGWRMFGQAISAARIVKFRELLRGGERQ